MVMMHGLGGSTNAFQSLISHFAPKYTILRFDFPGSGLSKFNPTKLISVPFFVTVLESILAARCSYEPSILIGHSLGSIIAMHYAVLHPDDVRALVLLGPGRAMSHIPAAVVRMMDLATKARGGIEDIRDSTVANNVAAGSPELAKTVVRQMISAQSPDGYAATCEALCAPSHVDPDYSAIGCPVVLFAGDQDLISPISRSQEIKELIEASSLARRRRDNVKLNIVHSGHQQVLEDTAGVVDAMEGFLSGLLDMEKKL
ncbi:MAG: alpha/beta fold hydrolase, partial [Janthinobacterium lividum]